jgi:integrase
MVLVNRKALTSIDSANARLKAIRKLSEWAVSTKPEKLMAANVAKDIPLLKRINTGGWHTWTLEEIDIYVAKYPLSTKEYLALMLFLLLGQRISDISKLGRQHIRRPEHISGPMRKIHPGRWLAFRHKNRNSKPVDLVIPILPQLETVLAASPCGRLTFLETEFKQPFTTKGLGNWFGDKCFKAKVPGRAHGLRKAGATIAAENGATAHQLMAIFGWKTLQQAELYTEKARQQLLAGGAMNLLIFSPTSED